MTRQKSKRKAAPSKKVPPRTASVVSGAKASLGRKLLRAGGTALGSVIGLPALGASAGDFFSNLLGMGDYKVRNNSIMRSTEDVPSFRGTSDYVEIEHREFITNVNSSQAFRLRGFPIAADNAMTFPWLSTVSQNFEQYDFKGLVFCYKPLSGSAISSTNNALGAIIMATEYDVSKLNFINKSQMENYEFSCSCKPDSSLLHPVECNPKDDIINSRYVNQYNRQFKTLYNIGDASQIVSQGTQENLNYLGNFQLATQGMQADDINVGELWVTYKVRLSKPRLSIPNPIGTYCVTSGGMTTYPNASGSNLFSGVYNVTADSTANLQTVGVDPTTNNVIKFYNMPDLTVINICVKIACDAGVTISNASLINSTTLTTATGRQFQVPGSGGVASFIAGSGTRYMVQNSFYFVPLGTSTSNLTHTITFNAVTTGAGNPYAYDVRITTYAPYGAVGQTIPYINASHIEMYTELEEKLRKLDRILEDGEEIHPNETPPAPPNSSRRYF